MQISKHAFVAEKVVMTTITIISIFHPLEVVGRGSDTQLQVGEKLNVVTERFAFLPLGPLDPKGYIAVPFVRRRRTPSISPILLQHGPTD